MTANAEAADRTAFPTPPRTVTDGEDRTVHLGTADERPGKRESLAVLYDAFGRADRAQGVPPADPRRRDRWLDALAEGVGVVAWHDEAAVGHGVLLDGGPGHELALFVHPDYRRAGVGSALLRTLLGRGQSAGVERAWLSVERRNRPAVRLYRGAGFEVTDAVDAETQMRRPL